MADPLGPIPPEQRPRHSFPESDTKAAVDRHLWEITAVQDLLWLAAGAALLWIISSLSSVFVPIFIGIFLAYLADPLIRVADRQWRIPRPLTVSLLLLLFSFAAAGLVMGIGPLLTEQVQTLVKKAPAYVSSLNQRLGNIDGLSDQIDATLSTFKEDPLSFLRPFFIGTGQAFGLLGTVIGRTVNFALAFLLIPLYFFFFGWYFDRMLLALSRLIPASRRNRVYGVLNRMDAAVSGFFHERLLIALITGAMYAVGWLAADVPYWFLLGLGTGLLTLIPYVSVIGWPLALLLKYLDSLTAGGQLSWTGILLWPSLAYLVVQFIESWILTPWIQQRSSDMNAVTLLIVMFIGGAAGGLFGLIFCIPIAACIKILFEEFLMPRWTRWAESQ
ncbi:AI-2E family transporter [Nitrospira sp. Nam80]